MNKLYFLILFLFIMAKSLVAQDVHLSNYQPAGMLFNPAHTGTFESDVQLGLQYRSQWSAIPVAYTTMGTNAQLRSKAMGFGLQVVQNRAGEASLQSTGVMLTGAYHKPLARHSTLSLGFGLGRLQKRFNPDSFTYDEQFVEGQGFDSALPSNETFTRTTASLTDVAVGLNWQGALGENENLKGRAGFSLSHVHLPNEGFSPPFTELPMKTVIQAGLDIRVDGRFTLSPDVLYQKQGVHREVVAGANISGLLSSNNRVHFGMALRLQDAIIGKVGFDLGNKSIWLSYDANTSPLSPASNGNGAWELGLYLRFDKNPKKELKDTDGDGIFDNRDDCPKVPGVPELNGCPEPESFEEKLDSDKDGVTDDLDRCPLEPGLACFYGCNDRDRDGTLDQDDACPTIFGPPENQGCPIKGRDSDRDGVPDDEDYCVFLKGSPKFHGCPDSDDDGISDIDDECPYLKGTVQNRGCPDDKAAGNKPADKAFALVEFETDQTFIQPAFRPDLDEFAAHVSAFESYRVMISGHTDSEGTDAYNYELGLRRAKMVQDYLWRQGVPFEKMEIISYGEEIPYRSNFTGDGRARNRRAEVSFVREP